MHIPDGFLSLRLTLPAYVVSVPIWGYAVKKHFGPERSSALPLIGSLTAFSFVVQTIMIPVPGGTSAHLVGCVLLALLFNPLVSFVCEGMVLAIQALFFGVGGITTLALNALAIGLIGPLVGFWVYRALSWINERVGLFLAGYLGILASTLAVVGVLGLQHWLAPEMFPLPFVPTALAMLIPCLTVLGVLEGLVTLAVVELLRKAHVGEASLGKA